MTIELRVPISPTPSFINQVLLQAASLRRFHPGSIIRAYVGHAAPTSEMRSLVENAFRGHKIGFEWVTGKSFTQWEGSRAPYLETMNRRWSDLIIGDVLIIADADVIFTGTLDDILCRDAVQGVQAHVPPMSDADFRYLFAICEANVPSFAEPYTGAGFMTHPNAKGPFYPNSGFVLLPRRHFEAMIPNYHMAINRMRQAMTDFYWFDQLALCIAAAKAGVPCHSLQVRFNHPNDERFDEAYPDELRNVRAVHYLRETQISRTKDFESLQALRRLVARDDLSGSHEILRRAVAANMAILEPRPLGSPGTEPPWA